MSSNPYRAGFAHQQGGGSSLPSTKFADPGSSLVWVGPGKNDFAWVLLVSPYGILGAAFDGAESILAVGRFCDVIVPANCTIKECEVLCSPSGSIEFSLTKTSYSLFPTTQTNIVGTNPPKVVGGFKSLDTTLTGWTVALPATDILRFTITSVTACTKASVALKVLK